MIISANELEKFCYINSDKYSVKTIEEAYIFVKNIASQHYENFFVGSVLLPKKKSKYFHSIYAFARLADDIADELEDKNKASALLTQYEENLNLIYNSKDLKTNNPILLSLKDTIEQNHIDILPFSKLITAFRKDIDFSQPETLEDVFGYCDFSANPIGELILTLFKENTSLAIHYSNCICTALQLINFWQDLSIDLARKRCYIPQALINDTIESNNYYEYFIKLDSKKLHEILTTCYEVTNIKLNEGKNILHHISNIRLKIELKLIIFMGQRILNKIIKQGNDILKYRPIL